jgi:curved DNA-binding protein CbpA
MGMAMTYYEIIGVAPDADGDTIRSAFRALARRYHPDTGAGSSAERFRKITEAYETLIDVSRRSDYDRSLRGRAVPMFAPAEPMVAPVPVAWRRFDVVFDRFVAYDPFDQDWFFDALFLRW